MVGLSVAVGGLVARVGELGAEDERTWHSETCLYTICCFIGVQHARCEDISVSRSFPQNTSQRCCNCLTLLDHFVVIKRWS